MRQLPMGKRLSFKNLKVGDLFELNHLKWKKVQPNNPDPYPEKVPQINVIHFYNAIGWGKENKPNHAYIAPHREVKRIK